MLAHVLVQMFVAYHLEHTICKRTLICSVFLLDMMFFVCVLVTSITFFGIGSVIESYLAWRTFLFSPLRWFFLSNISKLKNIIIGKVFQHGIFIHWNPIAYIWILIFSINFLTSCFLIFRNLSSLRSSLHIMSHVGQKLLQCIGEVFVHFFGFFYIVSSWQVFFWPILCKFFFEQIFLRLLKFWVILLLLLWLSLLLLLLLQMLLLSLQLLLFLLYLFLFL